MINKHAALAGLAAVAASVSANAAVTISTAATQNMTCSGGVCVPMATDAVLNVGDLQTMLALGNVSVSTTGSGVQAKDIDVRAAFSWSMGSALTLDAYESLTFDQPVSVQGLAGLSVVTNDGGKKGKLSFGKNGNVTFANLSSTLSISGTSYALVNTIASLASAIANNPSGTYAFASSYDAGQDGTYTTSPVSTTFAGLFEGLGNTISALSVDDPVSNDNVGLFAHLGSSGALDDIRLREISIKGPTQGDILGNGGLVGLSEGLVSGDSASGSVSIDKSQTEQGGSVGGLVGYEDGGSVVFSSANVKVNGKSIALSVGGLIGTVLASSVSDVQATGPTSGSNAVGGLAGVLVQGTMNECFATGEVTGQHGTSNSSAGGLIGGGGDATVSNSYATGNVSYTARRTRGVPVGGFAGLATSIAFSTSYSTGAPSGGKHAYIGGFLGDNNGSTSTMSDAYWDTTTSGTDIGVGMGGGSVTGLTTEQLQSSLPAGFDPKVWSENSDINGGLPYLLHNPPPK